MKLLITITALSLLLGTSALAMQSSDDKDKEKPAPKEEPRRQDQPGRRDNPDRQDRQENPDRDKDRPKQKQDRDRAQQQDRDRKDRDRAQQQDRDRQLQRDDRNRVQSQDRGQKSARQSGGRGRRIPDDRFRASFGREHTFHVQRGGSGGGGGGDQRFQYGGYWFEYADAWPGDWGYDDDFYIDYVDDDYYLYDLRHPRNRILVIVVE